MTSDTTTTTTKESAKQDAAAQNDDNMTTVDKPPTSSAAFKVSLLVKKPKRTARTSEAAIFAEDVEDVNSSPINKVPVEIIPAIGNHPRWNRINKKEETNVKLEEEESKQQQQQHPDEPEPTIVRSSLISAEDAEAARALENQTTEQMTNHKNLRVISESAQYKADVEVLPDEVPIDSDVYQAVPIAEFGAALLRGMGWKGTVDTKESDSNMAMPRPQRLGLGATPQIVDEPKRKSRRPDQFRRQEDLEKQQQAYQREREQKLAEDRQRTLQNGSLVHLGGKRRARILQLVGVPGLNMVKIQYEDDSVASVVKRGDIMGLVSRDELEKKPFRENELEPAGKVENDKARKTSSTHRDRDANIRDDSRKLGDRKRSRQDDERVSSEKRRLETWMVPNIRVRVITEKLGRRYFKDKGVIVDVTSKGATLRMPDGSVLDRVPERYVETALPKVGGPVVVLRSGSRKHAKGRLLERNSKSSKGVIQFSEDMDVMTLPLDDLAEWCGSLDDDLE